MPTFDTANSSSAYSVPSGVDVIRLTIDGSGGGAGGDGTSFGADVTGEPGGVGGRIVGTLPVSGGESYTVHVASAGSDGANTGDGSGGAAGASPYASGGTGGDGGSTDAAGGGGGGGVTLVVRDSDGAVVAAAAGAGGGGGGMAVTSDTTDGGGGGGGGARGGLGGTGGDGASGGPDGQDGGDGGGSGSGGAGGDGQGNNQTITAGDDGGTVAHTDFATSSATTGGGNSGAGQVLVEEAPSAPSLAIASHTDTSVDLDIGDTSNEDGVRVYYRETGAASWTLDADLGAGVVPTTHTVSGLTQGTDYEFYVEAYNGVGASSSGTVTQQTDAPAPTLDTFDAVDDDGDGTADELAYAWTRGGTDETAYRVFYSTDGGGTFVQANGDLAGSETSYTTGEQDHGTDHVGKVVAVYPDTTAASGTLTTTTELPVVTTGSITPIGASVEDELTVPNAAVANTGDVRYQIRVTGSGNAYGSDIVVAQGGADATFTGLADGEKYDIRARSETPDVTGTYVTVSEVTLLPADTNLQNTDREV